MNVGVRDAIQDQRTLNASHALRHVVSRYAGFGCCVTPRSHIAASNIPLYGSGSRSPPHILCTSTILVYQFHLQIFDIPMSLCIATVVAMMVSGWGTEVQRQV